MPAHRTRRTSRRRSGAESYPESGPLDLDLRSSLGSLPLASGHLSGNRPHATRAVGTWANRRSCQGNDRTDRSDSNQLEPAEHGRFGRRWRRVRR
ncbi:hypothetical protein FRACA_940012 [Frankia canadensis]|uniref:Uncharacterized protein n=1 Tax=Frankia canadensis TaxID=1836972 RepID=A0A2I2L2N3_9ACTN|nr:hypothetical protein FRACA_940012 [Frankia canadensis]SOU59461.1 hypothetical protein FRACA_940012 [Frankia canadensis]